EQRARVLDISYDLVINLEDTVEVAEFVRQIKCKDLFGAYLNSDNRLAYTNNSKRWFDLSIISAYGMEKADNLKLQNRRTYQDLIFDGLGFEFTGKSYLLPDALLKVLTGNVAIAV